MGWKGDQKGTMPVLVAVNPQGKHVVIAGNFADSEAPFSLKLGDRYINTTLAPHSFNTFLE